MAVGEYDKRLVLLSKERGRISAFAKGARKQNSVLLACSQPFCFGEFFIYEGRTANTIVSAEIKNYFLPLRENLTLLSYASYFCEVAGYFSSENNDELRLLKLLYQTLNILSKEKMEAGLIRTVFELRAITINGEGPQVFECVCCGANATEYAFSAEKGGLVCAECKESKAKRKLLTSTIYAMQYIVSSEIEKLYHFTVTKEVSEELYRVVTDYYKYRVGFHFKSLEFISLLP